MRAMDMQQGLDDSERESVSVWYSRIVTSVQRIALCLTLIIGGAVAVRIATVACPESKCREICLESVTGCNTAFVSLVDEASNVSRCRTVVTIGSAVFLAKLRILHKLQCQMIG
jgi:hypothetical protein